MKFIIKYHEKVVSDDIPKLSSKIKLQIKTSIENKLKSEPESYGKPLRKSLKGYRKLRVKNYRIIFRIEKKSIKIFAILHRSTVYKDMDKRL